MNTRRKAPAKPGTGEINATTGDPERKANLAKALEEAAEFYKNIHTDWGDVSRWPTDSGIKHMIEKLRA